jgi:VanZ family protein
MLKNIITWFEKHYIISLIIVIIFASIIFYLSSIPGSSFPKGLGISTKIYHISIFFLLSLFLIISIVRGKQNNKYLLFVAILIAIVYAATDEIHQIFVLGRVPAFTDVMIDSIGIILAGIIYSIRMFLNKHYY